MVLSAGVGGSARSGGVATPAGAAAAAAPGGAAVVPCSGARAAAVPGAAPVLSLGGPACAAGWGEGASAAGGGCCTGTCRPGAASHMLLLLLPLPLLLMQRPAGRLTRAHEASCADWLGQWMGRRRVSAWLPHRDPGEACIAGGAGPWVSPRQAGCPGGWIQAPPQACWRWARQPAKQPQTVSWAAQAASRRLLTASVGMPLAGMSCA